MLVEMMIFVTPSGGWLKTASCSSLDKVEWSGYTTHLMGMAYTQLASVQLPTYLAKDTIFIF